MKYLLTILIALILSCSDTEVTPNKTLEINVSGGSSGKVNYKAGSAGVSGMAGSAGNELIDVLVPGAFDQKLPQNLPMRYEGGPIMSNDANIYIIWYGDFEAETVFLVEYLLSNIGNTKWYKINSSYYEKVIIKKYVGNPKFPTESVAYDRYVSNYAHFMMSIHDNYSIGNEISEDDITNIIFKSIKDSKLPLDSNGVYLFLTAKDVDHFTFFGNFCSDFCGWHDYFKVLNVDIKYAFIGDTERCSKGCSIKKEYLARELPAPNGNWSADGMASIIAHELVEVITDPLPIFKRAWGDEIGYENADKCSWTYGQLYKTDNGSVANVKIGNKDFLIQQNWVLEDSIGNGHCGLNK